MLDRLARMVSAHPKRVLNLGVAAFVVAGVLGAGVADRLAPYGADDPDTESVIANERLEEAGYQEMGVLVLVEDVDVRTPAGARAVEEVAAEVRDVDGVGEVVGYAQTRDDAFVARTGDATYLGIFTEGAGDEGEDTAKRVAEALEGRENVLVGGSSLAQAQVGEKVESDLRRAEIFAFPILFLLSLLFFRSLVAALLPLMVGGLAIVGSDRKSVV